MKKRPIQRQEKKVKKTPQLKKAPRTPAFVDTESGSDDSDDEQEATSKQPQKASKTSEFVDTDTNDEQGRKPKKALEYSFGEQGPAVNYQRCIVMYSTEDEQEPAIKKPQKASKIPGGSDDESPQETPLGESTKKPPATSCNPVASCIHILTSGVRKGEQCRVRASNEMGKFCIYYKGQI